MRGIAKAIAAFVAGLTPAALIALLALFGVDLPAEVATALLGALSPILAALGAYQVPNQTSDDGP